MDVLAFIILTVLTSDLLLDRFIIFVRNVNEEKNHKHRTNISLNNISTGVNRIYLLPVRDNVPDCCQNSAVLHPKDLVIPPTAAIDFCLHLPVTGNCASLQLVNALSCRKCVYAGDAHN